MLRWFWDNKGSLLLSFVLAVTVWVAAVVAQDPAVEKAMEEVVPIQYTAPNTGLQIVGNPPTEARVTIKAPESVWQDISLETITIEVDLTGLEAGIHRMDLNPDYDLQPLQIVSVDPDTAMIKLEPILSKELPVTIRILGDPALTYEEEDAIASPEQATVVGPTSIVTKVVELRAEINIAGASQNIEQEVSLIAIDENDEPIEGVVITPDPVTILVPIAQGDRYRLLSVIPNVPGSPAFGYRTISITVIPNEVLVTSSDPDAFDTLVGFVETEIIDISTATETLNQNALLDLPEGIFPVQDQTVLVTVTIEPIESSKPFDLPIEIQGLPSGLDAITSHDRVTVVLKGPLAILEELEADDVHVVLNLADFEFGVHEAIIPEVIRPTGFTYEIYPATVEVELILSPTPTPVDSIMTKPIVALVGRPNVGKSTLFNRLAGERLAVVHDTPGTTRDRLVAEAEWSGVTFTIVDTGGIDPTHLQRQEPLSIDSADYIQEIRNQAEIAARDADTVIFLVDGESGLTPADDEVAEILRRNQFERGGVKWPPILLVVNKCENEERKARAVEFYELGFGEPIIISALHGTATGDMLDRLIEVMGVSSEVEEEDDSSAKIAIIGRPNVGKSSLLNKLLGEDRVIVSPIPGTTRDAVDTQLTYYGEQITLIDTAGIRRRGRIDRGVEAYSVLRAVKAIERADVVTLLIDAPEGVTAQDAHIAGMAIDKLKSIVVVVNKWDLILKDTHTMPEYRKRVRQELNFLDYVPVLFISVKTGLRVGQVLPTALQVQEERFRRIPTGELNRLVRNALHAHSPSSKRGKRLRIFYASQVRTDPPTFLFHVNDEDLVHFSYERYLENRIRAEHGFLGTPLRLSFRQ